MDFVCHTLVEWFYLKIAVLLVRCSGFPMRRVGSTFHMYYRLGGMGWRTPWNILLEVAVCLDWRCLLVNKFDDFTPHFLLSISIGSSVSAFIHTLCSQLGNLSLGHLPSNIISGIVKGHIPRRRSDSACATHHPQQTGRRILARHRYS